MFRFLSLLLIASFYWVSASAQSETIVLTNANIIDGVTDRVQTNASLIIKNGKIQTITIGTPSVPSDATVINLQGRYVMPGLIDAHAHIRNFDNAKRALLSGVTTVRSMGVDHFMDVGMRELHKTGLFEMPEFLAAGYHVRHSPAEGFFTDHPEMADLFPTGVKTIEEVKRMTQVMIDHGVDCIKVNATARAGLANTDPREPYYNEAQMRAIVETAAKAGIPVAAHAHGDEGGRAAVLGGVRSIEHGTYLSDETLKIMKERGTYLVPTMAVVTDLTEPGGDYDVPPLMVRGRYMLPRMRETVKSAIAIGVKVVASTDTGYDPDGTLRVQQELLEFQGIGMKPLQIIQSATSLAAELLGVEDHTGKIAEGMDADILVIERNPMEYLITLYDPLLIMNNGKVMLNRLEWKVKD